MQISAFDVHLFGLVLLYIGGVCIFRWSSEKNESENKNKIKISGPGRGAEPRQSHYRPHPSDKGSWAPGCRQMSLQPLGFLCRVARGWKVGLVKQRF